MIRLVRSIASQKNASGRKASGSSRTAAKGDSDSAEFTMKNNSTANVIPTSSQ